MPPSSSPRSRLQQQKDKHLVATALDGSFDAFLNAIAMGADPHQDDGMLLTKVIEQAVCPRAERTAVQDPFSVSSSARSSRTPVRDASYRATRWEVFEHLVQVSGLDINRGQAAVLVAPTREGDLPALRRLVMLGADPKRRPGLLGRAVSNDDLDVARFLVVEHGLSDPRAGSPASMRRMILAHLGQHEHQGLPGWERVQHLARVAEDLGVPIDGAMASLALLWLASRPAGDAGEVPAPIEDSVRLATWLVERGASLTSSARPVRSPSAVGMILGAAAYSGQRTLFDTLVSLGADPTSDQSLAIARAADAQRLDMVQHLMAQHGLSPFINNAAHTIAHQLRRRTLDAVRQVASQGADALGAVDRVLQQGRALGVPFDTSEAVKEACRRHRSSPDETPLDALLERLIPGTLDNGDHPNGGLCHAVQDALEQGHLDRADRILTISQGRYWNDIAPGLVKPSALANRPQSLDWLMTRGVDVLADADTVLQAVNERAGLDAVRDWFRVQQERVALRQVAQDSLAAMALRPRSRL